MKNVQLIMDGEMTHIWSSWPKRLVYYYYYYSNSFNIFNGRSFEYFIEARFICAYDYVPGPCDIFNMTNVKWINYLWCFVSLAIGWTWFCWISWCSHPNHTKLGGSTFVQANVHWDFVVNRPSSSCRYAKKFWCCWTGSIYYGFG